MKQGLAIIAAIAAILAGCSDTSEVTNTPPVDKHNIITTRTVDVTEWGGEETTKAYITRPVPAPDEYNTVYIAHTIFGTQEMIPLRVNCAQRFYSYENNPEERWPFESNEEYSAYCG